MSGLTPLQSVFLLLYILCIYVAVALHRSWLALFRFSKLRSPRLFI